MDDLWAELRENGYHDPRTCNPTRATFVAADTVSALSDFRGGPMPARSENHAPTPKAPPYLRHNHAQRTDLGQSRSDYLARLLEVSPPRAELGQARSVARYVSALSVTPGREPVAVAPLGEMPDFEALAEVQDDQDEVTDRFYVFRQLTERWSDLEVGPIRSLYLLNFVASDVYEEDVLKLGGFPRWPRSRYAGYVVPIHGIHTSARARGWLTHDIHLAVTLRHLALTWPQVEGVIVRAFFDALPHSYRQLLKGVPLGLCFLLWKHDLECWWDLSRQGAEIAEATDKLSALIWRTPFGPAYEPGLKNLGRLAQPSAWTEEAEQELQRHGRALADFARPVSPVERAVYQALAGDLWEVIQANVPNGEDLVRLPRFVQRIYRKAEGTPTGQRPEEFWQLLADLAYHLPVIRGLPDRRGDERRSRIRYVGQEPKRPASQSASAIRQIVQAP